MPLRDVSDSGAPRRDESGDWPSAHSYSRVLTCVGVGWPTNDRLNRPWFYAACEDVQLLVRRG